MQLVLVKWVDSKAMYGWHYKEYFEDEPAICASVGVLLYETDTKITICQSTGEQKADGLVIPKSAIRKMWKLRVR